MTIWGRMMQLEIAHCTGINSKSNVQPQSLILNTHRSFLIHRKCLFAGSSQVPTSCHPLSSRLGLMTIPFLPLLAGFSGSAEFHPLQHSQDSPPVHLPLLSGVILFLFCNHHLPNHYGALLSRSRKPLWFCLIKPPLCSNLHPVTRGIIGTLKFQLCFLIFGFCKGQVKCLARAPTLLSMGKALMGPWRDEEPRSDGVQFLSFTWVIFNPH